MKKTILSILGLSLILMCAGSCASSSLQSTEKAFAPVYLTNTSKYALLPPSASSEQIDGLQHMSASFNGKEVDADVYVLSDSQQLAMMILNDFGTTMASLTYDGSNLEFESNIFPKKMKSEYIVADFQLCLYDWEIMKPALKKIGIDFNRSLTETENGVTENRTLQKKGKVISLIKKKYKKSKDSAILQLESISYENKLRSYSYTLTSLDN
ncbi:MAG: DUF3261 domain-containing protein [Treponema sp.]|nr:DUF3261 domain-containing protein [Treponema sp.]